MVALAGAGWMAAGLISLAVGIVLNAPAACDCINTVHEFLYLGSVAFILGSGMVLLRKKIADKVRKAKGSARTKQ